MVNFLIVASAACCTNNETSLPRSTGDGCRLFDLLERVFYRPCAHEHEARRLFSRFQAGQRLSVLFELQMSFSIDREY